jgi:hypothetical protein
VGTAHATGMPERSRESAGARCATVTKVSLRIAT